MVESLAAGRTLLDGYALFFIGAGLLGVPALLLCVILARLQRQPQLGAQNAPALGQQG
jgi:PAT family beta-lactamase induction signal transducer AmpG